MKKSDELRVKTRKMIAKNLIILVALAVVFVVFSYHYSARRRIIRFYKRIRGT